MEVRIFSSLRGRRQETYEIHMTVFCWCHAVLVLVYRCEETISERLSMTVSAQSHDHKHACLLCARGIELAEELGQEASNANDNERCRPTKKMMVKEASY